MQRSTHLLLLSLVVSLASVDQAVAENKPSIATGEFLTVLAKNVATVLSPTLVGELRDGRPNRTAVNIANQSVQIITTTSTTPKSSETTKEPLKSFNLEADTVRSAQTQSEVGNQGFPFNYDDNYRYNNPTINSPGLQRPEFSSGLPFSQSGYYNPDLYRSYPTQTVPDRSPRLEENVPQRGESPAGVPAIENIGNGQPGRVVDSQDPTTANFDRFRNFDRFPNQYSALGNFQNFPFSPERLQDGRFNDGRFNDGRFNDGRFSPFSGNLPGNANLQGNPNFQNSIANNYPRNNFQSFGDPFQQRQHTQGSSSFDFLPSQRFQNSFDNYPRSLQRGPNLPGFYSPPYVPELRALEGFATRSPKVDGKKIEQASPSEVNAKAEKLDVISKKNSSDTKVATENPPVLNIEGQIRFGNLFLPALEDYSDLRFQPDAFRQYLFTSNKDNKNNNDKKTIDNDKKDKQKNINDNNTTTENTNDI